MPRMFVALLSAAVLWPSVAPAAGPHHDETTPTAAADLWTRPALYRIGYEVELSPLLKAGRRLRVWIPLPAEGYGQQNGQQAHPDRSLRRRIRPTTDVQHELL